MLARIAMVLSSVRAAQGCGSSSFPGVGASARGPPDHHLTGRFGRGRMEIAVPAIAIFPVVAKGVKASRLIQKTHKEICERDHKSVDSEDLKKQGKPFQLGGVHRTPQCSIGAKVPEMEGPRASECASP
jgi:hypothetical protein